MQSCGWLQLGCTWGKLLPREIHQKEEMFTKESHLYAEYKETKQGIRQFPK